MPLLSRIGKVARVASLTFIMAASALPAAAQATAPKRPPAPAAAGKNPHFTAAEEARLMQFVDKEGGYKDKHGGYFNPKAGTYTDEHGGVLDNWSGYTYKDGSYKSKLGDYYDRPTNTAHLANGEVVKIPAGSTPADVIQIFRDSVKDNDGYDRDFIRHSMLVAIRNEHPPGTR